MAETNPYSELVEAGLLTEQEAQEKYAQDLKENETPAGDTTPAGGELTGDTSGDPAPAGGDPAEGAEPTGDPAPAASAAPKPFYLDLGYEDENQVIQDINSAKELKARIAELQTKEAELKEKETLISKFESPYHHDRTAKIDQAYAKTKIEDFNLLNMLVSTTAETISSDPITAIAIAKVLDNPTLIGDGITFEDLLEVERAMAEKAGVSMEDKNSIEYKQLVIQSKSALAKINNFQQDLANSKGKYNFAKENSEQESQRFATSLALTTPKVEELLRSNKRKFEVNGVEFEVELSKDQLSAIKDNASRTAVQRGYDLNTADGVKALNELVGAFAKGAVVASGQFEKSLYETLEAKIRAQVLEEVSQGKPDSRSKPAGGAASKGKSSDELYFEQLMNKSRGIE